jgi:GDP/UDP-N,N'-diacetylbacillosamine 2-epimerase (hydrolysing)
MLKRAQAIVGNSSLGLLEAGFIGVPAINVGERQRDRLAGINVQFVDGNSVDIRSALETALFDTAYRENVRRAECIYGDGFMVERSIQFIKSLPDRNSLLAKRISY